MEQRDVVAGRAVSGQAVPDPTIEEILEVMARAGFPISREDAERLRPSVRRTRAMAAEVRALIAGPAEPSGPGTSPGRAPSR